MPSIERATLSLVNLTPPVRRVDAIQSFVTQETPVVRLQCTDGSEGVGYSYTIGTGGSSVVALLRDHLLPRLIGQDPDRIEGIWQVLLFHAHAAHVGAITSLALAAIDTALWDRRGKRLGLPLWKLAGGARSQVPIYTTEGGWLHLSTEDLVAQTAAAKQNGFLGAKIKIGRSHVSEDRARLQAVREAVGDGFELMVDANQAFSLSEALRRAHGLKDLNLTSPEIPIPAHAVTPPAHLSPHSPL